MTTRLLHNGSPEIFVVEIVDASCEGTVAERAAIDAVYKTCKGYTVNVIKIEPIVHTNALGFKFAVHDIRYREQS